MRCTLSMIAEMLGAECRVVRETCGERGIAAVLASRPKDSLGNASDGITDDALVVIDARAAEGCISARGALVALQPGESLDADACAQVDNLAVIELAGGAEEALDSALLALNRLSAWDEEMVEAILAGRDISEILAIGARMLANPIALFDPSSALVAQAGELPDGYERTIWGRVIREGASPLDFYTRDEQARIARELTEDARPGIFVPSRAPQHENLAALISVGGRALGSIGQVDLVAPFTRGQVDLAAHVRDRLQQALAIKDPLAQGGDGLERLVARLIDGERIDRSLLAYHLGRRGWQEADAYRITVLPLPEGTGSAITNATRRDSLMGLVRDGLSLIHTGTIVLLEREGACGADGAIESPGFERALSRLDLRAGASVWFTGLTNAQAFHRQALFALAESERAGSPRVAAVRYEDVFESHLAHLVADSVPVESVCDQRVLSIARGERGSDAAQGRELVRLLYAYLASGRNLNRCARLLYVHRNTLAYRIARLEKELGADLAELAPSEVVRLELSCLLALND